MNAEDFNITTWRNLLLSYKHAEAEIDKFMPARAGAAATLTVAPSSSFPMSGYARHETSGNFQGRVTLTSIDVQLRTSDIIDVQLRRLSIDDVQLRNV